MEFHVPKKKKKKRKGKKGKNNNKMIKHRIERFIGYVRFLEKGPSNGIM